MESLEDILNRLTTSSSSDTSNGSALAAIDEPHCDICDDARWLSVGAPVGSPNFGRVVPCECQERAWGVRPADRLRWYSDLGPLSRLTFDNMDPAGRQGHVDPATFRRALDAAKSFAGNPAGWLVISGPSGTGKTHLAVAIANDSIARGQPARFVAVPDLLDHMRAAFDAADGAEYDEVFGQVIEAPLLVLDDLGVQSATPWADEKLDQILTHRHNMRLPTVITVGARLDRLSERVQMRITDPALATFVQLQAGSGNADRSEVGIETRQLSLMTFESFDPRGGSGATAVQRETLREALKAARTFAGDPDRWLYLAGPTGTGKTHLAVAIANARLKLGRPVIFRFVPDLLDYLRRSFNPDSPVQYEQAFARLRNAELLILDDLGAQASTAWAEEKLYQLIVHRHNAALPTVITSRVLLEDVDDSDGGHFLSRYSDAIASRLRDSHVVTERLLQAPDFRHRGAARPVRQRRTRTVRRS